MGVDFRLMRSQIGRLGRRRGPSQVLVVRLIQINTYGVESVLSIKEKGLKQSQICIDMVFVVSIWLVDVLRSLKHGNHPLLVPAIKYIRG